MHAQSLGVGYRATVHHSRGKLRRRATFKDPETIRHCSNEIFRADLLQRIHKTRTLTSNQLKQPTFIHPRQCLEGHRARALSPAMFRPPQNLGNSQAIVWLDNGSSNVSVTVPLVAPSDLLHFP
jgi:hypothetical protein